MQTYISDAYTSRQLLYQWQSGESVDFVPGMTLSQFDLMSFAHRNFTLKRREGKTRFQFRAVEFSQKLAFNKI